MLMQYLFVVGSLKSTRGVKSNSQLHLLQKHFSCKSSSMAWPGMMIQFQGRNLDDFAHLYITRRFFQRQPSYVFKKDVDAHTFTVWQKNTHAVMSHIVLWWVRPDRVLGSEGNAAHSDDRQDAELKILQSQDVVTALSKPGADTQTYTSIYWHKNLHKTNCLNIFGLRERITYSMTFLWLH